MSKIILEKLIYRNYLKTALTSILFIEIALIIIYFTANNNMINTSTNFILNDIEKTVKNLVLESTSKVEHKFEDIDKFAVILQNEHQNFFKYYNDIKIENPPTFNYAKNGMYYKLNNNGGSSVVISKNTEVTPKVKKKLINSEIFDKTFKTIVENDEIIVAAYFNSFDNFNRYYPFIEDVHSAFPADIVMENYNFYYDANIKNNPDKKVVWTDVYLDPAGQGWMLSAIAPIYNGNFLEGVSGIDVTMNTLINNFLDFELPYKGSSFLMDKNGNVIASTKKIEDILAIKHFEEYKYAKDEKIEKTIYNKDLINLFNSKNEELSNSLKKLVKNKEFSSHITIGEDKYLIFSQKVQKVGWFLISLINEKEIISQMGELKEYYKNIGYWIIVFIIVFYFIFFIFLYSKARHFVKSINEPLLKIIEMTKNLGRKRAVEKLESCGIKEIDTLNENFNILASELEDRTRELVESETKRVYHEELASKDSLTNVYNRRFLEDFSSKYMKIVKREHTTLSLLVIDIDNFKKANDTYGHDVGDKILINLVERMKNSVRDNDLIVRLGGDEFLILLPNTDISNAKKVAQKLMFTINTLNQLEKKELTFTVSIGISEYEKNDENIECLIKRADQSLYDAKAKGKNCIA